MSFAEIALAIAFLAGAGFVGWAYTLTERGRTIGTDILKTNKRRGRWWMSRAFLARHWPIFVLILAYVLIFGLFAPNL